MEYKLVRASSYGVLETLVTSMLRQGFRPAGGFVVDTASAPYPVFIQAVWKEA